jgi:hypothetical protein
MCPRPVLDQPCHPHPHPPPPDLSGCAGRTPNTPWRSGDRQSSLSRYASESGQDAGSPRQCVRGTRLPRWPAPCHRPAVCCGGGRERGVSAGSCAGPLISSVLQSSLLGSPPSSLLAQSPSACLISATSIRLAWRMHRRRFPGAGGADHAPLCCERSRRRAVGLGRAKSVARVPRRRSDTSPSDRVRPSGSGRVRERVPRSMPRWAVLARWATSCGPRATRA